MKPVSRSRKARRKEMERILTELGYENLSDLEQWTEKDLEALRPDMGEEQYQALLDLLEDPDERDR